MKIKIILSIFVICFLLNYTHSSTNLKTNTITTTNTEAILKNNLEITSKLTKTEITTKITTLWAKLFSSPQATNCVAKTPEKLLALNPDYFLNVHKGKGKFYWVKFWGFDNAAYLYDFLDPVFRADICAEFKLMYDKVYAFPIKNTNKSYQMVNGKKIEIHKKFNLNDPWRDPYDVKHMDPKQSRLIDWSVYGKSINTVQLNQAIEKFKWYKDPMVGNHGKKMVSDHDFNNDGRLSVREFIIAAIRTNDKIFGSYECELCFKDFIDKIDAMFTFIDCDNNGLISAEDMYQTFPHMKRPTQLWNYFVLADQAKIRTHVTNDFVLKNMQTVSGNLTKEEFRRGILLGFWDRQTDDYAVIKDDSKNIKSLRWRGNSVDVSAERYIQAMQAKKIRMMNLMNKQNQRKKSSDSHKDPFKITTNDVFK